MITRKVVAIVDCSAGNDSVGEMWKETKIFSAAEPIENILRWAYGENILEDKTRSKRNLVITVPDEVEKENV